MKILIVEDNALVALDLEQQVIDSGHIVVGIAATMKEAVRLAREHGADLALMDVSLADGSSGVDAAEMLKIHFNIPSVFVTATLPPGPKARQIGMGHLNKPYSEEQVVAVIHAVEAILQGSPRPAVPAAVHLFV